MKPSNDHIIVKTERDPIVKEESEMDDMPCVQVAVSCTKENISDQLNSLKAEKIKIIDELVQIKSGNQKIKMELLSKNRKIEQLEKKVENTSEKLDVVTKKNAELKQNLGLMKKDYDDARDEIKKITQSNKVLTAKIAQLQRSMNDTSSTNDFQISNDSESKNTDASKKTDENASKKTDKNALKNTDVLENNDVYEVEKLINDRKVRGKRQFLVRWKGYAPDADTWEAEGNLNCPKKLKLYWASKSKQ